jgi:hypothetical protein
MGEGICSAADWMLETLHARRREIVMRERDVASHDPAVAAGNKMEARRTKDPPRMLQKARHKNGESNVQADG